ncbi:hypothetical protein ACGFYV_18605 [Streptomyces sp. NPDC048297]|uniref:hypothetical protein n=1 Tax=Streptomyces sp. NPDC048297 TaxID=3365531 RepID=UPI003715530B
MRRTARALSVAVLAGAALVIPGPAAYADPAAEATPGPLQPGGPASAPAACGPSTGPAPQAHEATPQAFEDHTMSLRRSPGSADCSAGTDGQDKAWSPDAAGEGEGDEEGDGQDQGSFQDEDSEDAGAGQGQGQDRGQEQDEGEGAGAGQGQDRSQEQGEGQDEGQGQGHEECADSHSGDCAPASVQHGVEAGAGGSFNDSVPALVIGGALIATACGGGAYRLYGRRRSPQA